MFHPQPMERVVIAAPRDRLEKVIDALYEAKALHLKEHVPADSNDLKIGKPLPDAERTSQLLLQLQGLKTLVPAKSYGKQKGDVSLPAAAKKLAAFRKEADGFIQERAQLEARQKALAKEIEELDFLAAAGVTDLGLLTPSRHLELMAGYLPALPKNGAEAVILAGPKSSNGIPVLIFVKKGETLSEGLLPVALSEWPAGPLRPAREARAAELACIEGELSALDHSHARLAAALARELPPIESSLLRTLRKSEAPLRFGQSGHAFLIHGWVPAKRAPALRSAIAGLGKDVYLHAEPAGDDAPTILKNPQPLSSFEFFLRLYSLPRAKEIDPTFFVFLTFPIFYGVMLGDIGYGLVILLASALLWFKMPRYKGLFTIFMVSAVFTILFGWFFGEFFGTESILGLATLHPFIHRLEQVQELLGLSLYFALFHINISLLFGFVNELKHSVFRAVAGKLGWIVFQLGGIPLIVSAFMGQSSLPLFGLAIPFPPTIVSYALTTVGVLMIIAGERFQGVIEIPGLIANFLSYMRLAAIGLASASLALVINGMAGSLFASGGLFWIMGALVIGMGHTINILLGMLDSFLQSLRLHYVETFPKFYHGGGEAYRPFGK